MTDRLMQMRLDEATQVQDLLTPDPLIVRLNKVFSWQQSASRWPYYLSRAKPGYAYTKDEITRQVFGDDQSSDGDPYERGWLSSIFALFVDREHQEVRIEGVALFERVEDATDRFRISDDGLALAYAYSADRQSANWKRIFAGILARNDVRVRCLLLHLGRWGYLLTFREGTSPEAFFLPGKGGSLRSAAGEETPLFDYTRGGCPAYSFTPLLSREPRAILGPFLASRIERMGMRVPEHVEFEGGREPRGKMGSVANRESSGNNLRVHMKQALALFRDIGALAYVPHRQGWTLSRERCAALFEPELVADLFGGAPDNDFLDALRAACGKLGDAEGLVHIATIRDYVCDELDVPSGDRADYFNQQVAYYLRPDVGRLHLGRTFHAQAGPGDCLFGDLALEYVEFVFTP